MTIVRISLALAGLSLTLSLVAQQRMVLGTSLDQLIGTMDSRCPVQAAELESKRSQLDAASFRMGQALQAAVCDCAPARARILYEDAANPELSREATVAEIQAFVTGRIVQPCMVDMFRDMFSGELCRELFPETTCTCMTPELPQYTDAQAMAIGASFAVWRQAEDKARRDGTAPPRPTPQMERFLALLEKCSDA